MTAGPRCRLQHDGGHLRDLPSQASHRAVWAVPRAGGREVTAYLRSTYLAVMYCSCKRQYRQLMTESRKCCFLIKSLCRHCQLQRRSPHSDQCSLYPLHRSRLLSTPARSFLQLSGRVIPLTVCRLCQLQFTAFTTAQKGIFQVQSVKLGSKMQKWLVNVCACEDRQTLTALKLESAAKEPC